MSVSYFDSLRWPRERLEAALRLVAADPATLASAVEIDDATFCLAWSFDAFRQYPVIRLEGDRLFILSPSFLVARLFGWLPLYDLREALRGESSAGRVSERPATTRSRSSASVACAAGSRARRRAATRLRRRRSVYSTARLPAVASLTSVTRRSVA